MKRLNFYFKYAWRSVWRGGRLSAFAIACIAVGIATLVALQSLTASLRETLTGNVQERAGGDLVAEVNLDGYYRSSLYPQARQLLDNLKSQGIIEDWSGFTKKAVQITGYFNVPPTLYVINPANYPLYGKIPMVEPVGGDLRRLLAEPNTIILSKSIWKAKGYKLGEEIEVSKLLDFVRVSNQSASLKVVGVIDPDLPGLNFDPGLFTGFGVTSFDTAASLLNRNELIPATFYIKTKTTANQALVAKALQDFNQQQARYFPFFTLVRTADQIVGENDRYLQPVEEVLLYVGLVTILVGGVGCINTMLVLVRQRTGEIATIKALGLKESGILTIFTLQVLILGVIGSGFGLLAGVVLGFGMKSLVEALFGRSLAWGLYPAPLLTGLVVGTVVAGLFGMLPAYSATRIRPAQVLRQTEGALPRVGGLQTLLTLGLLTTLLGLLAGLLIGNIEIGLRLAFITLAVLLALGLVLYLIIYLTGRFPVAFGSNFRLAVRSFNRQRARTTATLLVITVSLFFVSLITLVSDIIRTNLQDTFDYKLGFNAGAVNVHSQQDEELKAYFEKEIPGVRQVFVSNVVGADLFSVNRQRLDDATAAKNPACGPFLDQDAEKNLHLKSGIQVSGRSLLGGQSISPNGPQSVLAGRNFQPDDMNQNVMLVTQPEAECYGLKVGDKVRLRLRANNLGQGNRGNGIQELTVIGIVSRGTAGTNFEQGFVVPFGMVNKAGAEFSIFFMQIDPAQMQTALSQIQRHLYSNFVFDLTDLITIISDLLSRTLALPLLLSLLSLISGSVLIANNVALAVLERRTEIGVLKALGANRKRVLAILLWENGLLGLLGGLLGVGSSLTLLFVLKNLVNRSTAYANLNLVFSPLSIGLLLGLSVSVAVAATLVSAWKAVQERPNVILRESV